VTELDITLRLPDNGEVLECSAALPLIWALDVLLIEDCLKTYAPRLEEATGLTSLKLDICTAGSQVAAALQACRNLQVLEVGLRFDDPADLQQLAKEVAPATSNLPKLSIGDESQREKMAPFWKTLMREAPDMSRLQILAWPGDGRVGTRCRARRSSLAADLPPRGMPMELLVELCGDAAVPADGSAGAGTGREAAPHCGPVLEDHGDHDQAGETGAELLGRRREGDGLPPGLSPRFNSADAGASGNPVPLPGCLPQQWVRGPPPAEHHAVRGWGDHVRHRRDPPPQLGIDGAPQPRRALRQPLLPEAAGVPAAHARPALAAGLVRYPPVHEEAVAGDCPLPRRAPLSEVPQPAERARCEALGRGREVRLDFDEPPLSEPPGGHDKGGGGNGASHGGAGPPLTALWRLNSVLTTAPWNMTHCKELHQTLKSLRGLRGLPKTHFMALGLIR
jgi:hypothetical protein